MRVLITCVILAGILSCSLQRRGKKTRHTSIAQDKKILLYSLKKAYIGNFFAPGIDTQKVLRKIKKISKKTSKKSFEKKINKVFKLIPDNLLIATSQLLSLRPEKAKWEIGDFSIGDQAGLIIKVPFFEKPESPYWKGFLEKVKDKLADKKFLLIDLRGSKGIDDSVGLALAKYLNGQVLRHPIIRQHHIHNKQSVALLNNFYNLHYPEKNIKIEKHFVKNSQIPIIPIEFKRDAVGYLKKYSPEVPIILLVDENCEMACESTLMAFEENPLHIIVGQKTKGTIHFSHPGILYLPHSEVFVYIPTSYNEYHDGRFLEKKGVHPHILMEAHDDFHKVLEMAYKKKLMK